MTTLRATRAVRIAIVAAVHGIAAILWLVLGPVQVGYGTPDGAAWVLAGPGFGRGPSWEAGTHLLVRLPGAVALGLWTAHVAVAWLLRHAGLVRRPWLVVAASAVAGQGLLTAAFCAAFAHQL